MPEKPDRPRYRLTIRSEPCDTPAVIRLRRVLKGLLRSWKFRAELVEELQPDPAPIAADQAEHQSPESP